MKGIAILGSTGTIGEATLDVAGRHPDRFRVVALAAHSNHEALYSQLERYRPAYAALADRTAAARLAQRVASAGLPTRVLAGPDSLCTVATLPEADAVMAAIVGAAGLAPTLAAAAAGKQLLLANKEALVLAGRF
jgi:1-deoxy-D-xylulose-5-phosphate reductoisomerase